MKNKKIFYHKIKKLNLYKVLLLEMIKEKDDFIDNLTKENNNNIRTLKDVKKENESKIETLRKENAELDKRLDSFKDQYSNMSNENQSLIFKIRTENEELKEKNRKKDQTIEMYDRKFEQLDEDSIKYKQRAVDIENKMETEIQKRIDDMNAIFQKKESEYQEKISLQEKNIGILSNGSIVEKNNEIVSNKQSLEKSNEYFKHHWEIAKSNLEKYKNQSKKVQNISREIQVCMVES